MHIFQSPYICNIYIGIQFQYFLLILKLIFRKIGVAKLSTIAKIYKYRELQEGHHFYFDGHGGARRIWA